MPDETGPNDWEKFFKLWCEYEKVAMHFNDLIIKLRTQALAGVAATAAILVGFLSRTSGQAGIAWGILAAGFGFLLALWCALWVLDFSYYYRLLRGAVAAIVELEGKSSSYGDGPEINLSRKVENEIWPGVEEVPPDRIECGIWVFYGVVAGLLTICTIVSLFKYFC